MWLLMKYLSTAFVPIAFGVVTANPFRFKDVSSAYNFLVAFVVIFVVVICSSDIDNKIVW
jgi:hypothetical protein